MMEERNSVTWRVVSCDWSRGQSVRDSLIFCEYGMRLCHPSPSISLVDLGKCNHELCWAETDHATKLARSHAEHGRGVVFEVA